MIDEQALQAAIPVGSNMANADLVRAIIEAYEAAKTARGAWVGRRVTYEQESKTFEAVVLAVDMTDYNPAAWIKIDIDRQMYRSCNLSDLTDIESGEEGPVWGNRGKPSLGYSLGPVTETRGLNSPVSAPAVEVWTVGNGVVVMAAKSAEPVAWCSEGALKMAAAGVPAIIHAYPPPVDPVALYRAPKEAPDV